MTMRDIRAAVCAGARLDVALRKNGQPARAIAAHSLFNAANLVLLCFEEPVNQFFTKI